MRDYTPKSVVDHLRHQTKGVPLKRGKKEWERKKALLSKEVAHNGTNSRLPPEHGNPSTINTKKGTKEEAFRTYLSVAV